MTTPYGNEQDQEFQKSRFLCSYQGGDRKSDTLTTLHIGRERQRVPGSMPHVFGKREPHSTSRPAVEGREVQQPRPA